jgi:hypothetical protein
MPMRTFDRTVSKHNVDGLILKYLALVAQIGNSVSDFKGLELFRAIKRDKVGVGPYPAVTLFEAANRIMTDMVILYGVKWLLDTDMFPFATYTVEYGNENKNPFDIQAVGEGKKLVGEAFNVAESFFQGKKASMLKKLSGDIIADYKLIMFNRDAIRQGYTPKPKNGEYFVVVSVGTDDTYMVPELR